MTNGDPCFPLLRLSQDAILRVLKSMEVHQLVLLSFSSTRSKSLVASLNLKSSNEGRVWVQHGINVVIFLPNGIRLQWKFYRNEFRKRDPDAPPMKMTKSRYVILCTEGPDYPYSWSSSLVGVPLGMKDWLKHIEAIFHTRISYQLAFWYDEGCFDYESIRDAIEEISEVTIASPGTEKQNSEKMKAFLLSKSLKFGSNVWPEKKPPGRVLMQNFDFLRTGFDGQPGNIDLDDLLLFNSRDNFLEGNKLTEKDMNRYLKLWMKNRGDCRMEFMLLRTLMDIDKTAVFKGINYKELEILRERWYKPSSSRQHSHAIHGGYDIIRRDGMRATIMVDGKWMKMFVWHSHCVGEPRVLS